MPKFLLLLVTLLLTYCSSPEEVSGSESQSGTIFGRILLDSLAYDNDVDIKLLKQDSGATSYSIIDSLLEQQGDYEFTDLTAGNYKLMAYEQDELIQDYNVVLQSAENIQIDIVINITINNNLTINQLQPGSIVQNIFINGANVEQIDSNNFNISITEFLGDTLFLSLLVDGQEQQLQVPILQDSSGNILTYQEEQDDLPFIITFGSDEPSVGPSIVYSTFDSTIFSQPDEIILLDFFGDKEGEPEIHIQSKLLIPQNQPRSLLDMQLYSGIFGQSVSYEGTDYYLGKLASYNTSSQVLTRFTDDLLYTLDKDSQSIQVQMNFSTEKLANKIIPGYQQHSGIYTTSLEHNGLVRLYIDQVDWMIQSAEWVTIQTNTIVSDGFEIQGITLDGKIFNVYFDPDLNVAVDEDTYCDSHKPELIGEFGPTQGFYCFSSDGFIVNQYWDIDDSKHNSQLIPESNNTTPNSLRVIDQRVYGVTSENLPAIVQGDVRDSLWIETILDIPIKASSIHSSGITQYPSFIAIREDNHQLIHFFFLGKWQSKALAYTLPSNPSNLTNTQYFLTHDEVTYFLNSTGEFYSIQPDNSDNSLQIQIVN